MADKESGISRAIAYAGNQAALSRMIWDRCKVHLWQARISDGERCGYVSFKNAELISRATGVPVEDLIRQEKRQRRVVKK
jgi:hypothetical protein